MPDLILGICTVSSRIDRCHSSYFKEVLAQSIIISLRPLNASREIDCEIPSARNYSRAGFDIMLESAILCIDNDLTTGKVYH